MKNLRSRFFLGFLALSLNLPAVTIVGSNVSQVGTDGMGQAIYRYSYDLGQVSLLLNQELLIEFDAAQFQALSNSIAVGNFDLLVFQPNNPVGAPGGYSLLALQDNPAMTGPFSVDVILTGGGFPPASLPFFINQLDAQGGFLRQVDAGITGVPEPGTLTLCFLVGSILVSAGYRRAAQRSRQ